MDQWANGPVGQWANWTIGPNGPVGQCANVPMCLILEEYVHQTWGVTGQCADGPMGQCANGPMGQLGPWASGPVGWANGLNPRGIRTSGLGNDANTRGID